MTTPQQNVSPDEASIETTRRWPWWTPWAAALAVAAVVIGLGSWIVYSQDGTGNAMNPAAGGVPPAVTGYYNPEQIQFLHTETSDAEVADLLTDMMDGSPVIHTPFLADASEDMLGPVFAFTNGLRPDGPRGPFGYQPDVFDTVPGDPEYTPLRSVHLVEWNDGTEPRLLTSAAEVRQAEQAGEITVTEPGIVVTMPITTWPGGQR